MLHHLNSLAQLPERVVVLGAGGFVGGAIARRLAAAGANVCGLTRHDVDLQASAAGESLARLLSATDIVVCVSAIAPVRSLAMLKDNLAIVEAMVAALDAQPVAHVVNISSDAVYADSPDPLTEMSCTAPASLHGVMHLTREIALREAAGDAPFATLRPTLIYGSGDPHDGYGPNRFRRLARAGDDIVLFGEGEERRDHVWIEDVAELVARIVLHRSQGCLNAATGTVISFRECAELVSGQFDHPTAIRSTPRSGPMPHNGYRPFDPAATMEAFPDFGYAQPADGFARVHAETAGSD